MASTGEVTAQQESKTRFATVNSNDYENILMEKDSLNTRKATVASVRLFRQYLREKGYSEDFEEITEETLDDILCKFYVEARNKTGQLYKKTSLTAFRHGINRHLKNVHIVNGSLFKKSNEAFSVMVAQRKRDGFGGVEHHPPMEKSDLEKLYSIFDVYCPESLQQKVFVDILLYFGRRGRENLRDLKISDFNCTQDADGYLYIYLHKDEQTKNHQTDTNTADGRMYEVKNADERCPVKSFVRYKRLLPPGCNWLFPRVRKSPNKEGFYFDNAPMGHNKLGKMMSMLSEKAGLSRKYTNHSLRTSSVHLLDSADIPTRHIMTVTGHKAESSLKTYTGYTDASSKRRMLDTISSGVGLDVKRQKAESSATSLYNTEIEDLNSTKENNPNAINDENQQLALLTNPQTDHLISEFELDTEFDNIITGLPFLEEHTMTKHVNQTVTYNTSAMPMMPLPTVNAHTCHVVINYNITNK